MKKLFDKFIAQSSRGQMALLAVLFIVLAVVGGFVGRSVLEKDDPDSAKFGRRETWGLMQCVDGGFVDATISSNTKLSSPPKDEKIVENAPITVIVLSLGFWLAGMILISFFTGAATNFLDVRRERILSGTVDYAFRKRYILIVGYDFQTGHLIRDLFEKYRGSRFRDILRSFLFREKSASRPSIVLVTDTDVGQIYDDLLPELLPCEARKLFIMRKDITLDSSYDKFLVTGAAEIYVIGDGAAAGRDGKTLRAFDAVVHKAEREMKFDAPHIARLSRIRETLDRIKDDLKKKENDEKAKAELRKIEENEKSLKRTQISLSRPVKAYLHIEDSVLYSSIRAIELSMDRFNELQYLKAVELLMNELKTGDAGHLMAELEKKHIDLLETILREVKPMIFDLDVFNYYESWAWECWSDNDGADGTDAYLPIRHEKAAPEAPATEPPAAATPAKHAELFVIGASRMGLAMVNFAMPLMNYGAGGKHCRITIFDPEGSKRGLLPDQKTLDALPEVEVVFRELDGCSEEANELMLEAAEKEDTSVTVVIAVPDPLSALRIYAGFSKELCRKEISVLVWQATDSEAVPDKSYLRMGGTACHADRRKVRYFGMTDRLPWKNPARSLYGMAVNYYYASWFSGESPVSPAATAPDFVGKAAGMWNRERPGESESAGTVAGTEWMNTPRWQKWSSINCGDTFREKAGLLEGVPYEEAAEKILKAEHNRWWTEKLLGGWLPSEQKAADAASHADKEKMTHGDMVPFEELSDKVKDKDKINIAAMAAYGFLK